MSIENIGTSIGVVFIATGIISSALVRISENKKIAKISFRVLLLSAIGCISLGLFLMAINLSTNP